MIIFLDISPFIMSPKQRSNGGNNNIYLLIKCQGMEKGMTFLDAGWFHHLYLWIVLSYLLIHKKDCLYTHFSIKRCLWPLFFIFHVIRKIGLYFDQKNFIFRWLPTRWNSHIFFVQESSFSTLSTHSPSFHGNFWGARFNFQTKLSC